MRRGMRETCCSGFHGPTRKWKCGLVLDFILTLATEALLEECFTGHLPSSSSIRAVEGGGVDVTLKLVCTFVPQPGCSRCGNHSLQPTWMFSPPGSSKFRTPGFQLLYRHFENSAQVKVTGWRPTPPGVFSPPGNWLWPENSEHMRYNCLIDILRNLPE